MGRSSSAAGYGDHPTTASADSRICRLLQPITGSPGPGPGPIPPLEGSRDKLVLSSRQEVPLFYWTVSDDTSTVLIPPLSMTDPV